MSLSSSTVIPGCVRVALRFFLLLLLVTAFGADAPARRPSQTPFLEASGKFILYKYQRRVGEETFVSRQEGDLLLLDARFALTFVGDKVELTAKLRTGGKLTAERFEIKGRTSTRTEIDRSIEVRSGVAVIREGGLERSVAARAPFFVTGGYAPLSLQEALFRHWKANGGVKPVSLLPAGSASFEYRGRDVVPFGGRRVELRRYSVSGVTWGRETAWFDARDNLVALLCGDAEMDRFEAVREGYESSLPFFVSKSAADAVADLELLFRQIRPLQSGRYAIAGATLFDGTERSPVADAMILIDGGRIAAAGARRQVRLPKGVPLFEARGMTILPGLWDTHAHATQAEWFPASLAAGITTMRDAANEADFITPLRDAVNRGRALGPRLLLAGYIDSGPQALGSAVAETEEEAVAHVRRYHRAGYEQIKIYQSIKPALVSLITAEAHRLGMSVTGHVPTGMNVFDAVGAGMDQINHVNYLFRALYPRDYRPQPGQSPPPFDTESLAARAGFQFLQERGTVVEPTLARTELNLFPRAGSFAAREPGLSKAPFELASPLHSMGISVALAARARERMAQSLRLTAALHRAGIPLMTGSDLVVPGHSIFRELELLVESGLNPAEAIRAATAVPARVLGQDREAGTIEVGKRADLIIVGGNPLERIGEIRKTKFVVRDGRLYDCAVLWRAAGFQP
jgi:imidazolonepropionase-like amidohydrolase